jgi:hypothetical protein
LSYGFIKQKNHKNKMLKLELEKWALDIDDLRKLSLESLLKGTSSEGDKLNFRFETDWQPTKSELEGVIEAWERRNARALIGGAPGHDRVGVKTRGESGTKWFDRASCSDEMDLGQPLENSLHWTPQELTDIIQSVREPVAQLAAAAGGVS